MDVRDSQDALRSAIDALAACTKQEVAAAAQRTPMQAATALAAAVIVGYKDFSSEDFSSEELLITPIDKGIVAINALIRMLPSDEDAATWRYIKSFLTGVRALFLSFSFIAAFLSVFRSQDRVMCQSGPTLQIRVCSFWRHLKEL
jgi:ABC-type multidrug transport system permease subunit